MKFEFLKNHRRTILTTFFSIIIAAPAFSSNETLLDDVVNISQNQLFCRLNRIEGGESNFFGRRHPQLPIVGDEIQIDFTRDEIINLMSAAERGIPLSELAGSLIRTSDVRFSKMNVFHGTFDWIEAGEAAKTYSVTLTKVNIGPGPAHISLVRTGAVVTLDLDCKN